MGNAFISSYKPNYLRDAFGRLSGAIAMVAILGIIALRRPRAKRIGGSANTARPPTLKTGNVNFRCQRTLTFTALPSGRRTI